MKSMTNKTLSVLSLSLQEYEASRETLYLLPVCTCSESVSIEWNLNSYQSNMNFWLSSFTDIRHFLFCFMKYVHIFIIS